MLLLTLGGSGRPAGAAPPSVTPADTTVSASPATAPAVVGVWEGQWSAAERSGVFQARMIRGLRRGTVYAELTQEEDGRTARVSRSEGLLTAGGVRFAVPGGEIVLRLAGNDRLEGTLVRPAGATVALTRVHR